MVRWKNHPQNFNKIAEIFITAKNDPVCLHLHQGVNSRHFELTVKKGLCVLILTEYEITLP